MLFLDKVFLKPRQRLLRGAELSNIGLARDLERHNVRLVVPAHYSWGADFRDGSGHGINDIVSLSGNSVLLNGLSAVIRLRHRAFRAVIVSNVANSLIPAILLLRACQSSLPFAVIAHRLPTARFVASLPVRRTRIVAVNSFIADTFGRAGFRDVLASFGHVEAARFHPPGTRRYAAPGTKVNFCVVGCLDCAWKGADTAVAAFRNLPREVAGRCVLHLASYARPPAFPEDNILAYAWMAAGEMPDWLRRMDVMIVPSRDDNVMRETFSLSMVEGMLTGLPVIASSLPVLAEKLTEGGGYVFRGVEDLARLMSRLVECPEMRASLGARARSVALQRYVWDTAKFIDLCLA